MEIKLSEEFRDLCDEIRRVGEQLACELEGIPDEEQVEYVRRRLSTFPKPLADGVTAYYFAGRNLRMAERDRVRDRQKHLAFSWGIAFILLLVAISLFVPNPSPWQYTLYRIVLSVSAAGFANYIEGMLNVKAKWLRASGPLATFAVVYLVSPALLPAMAAAARP